MLIAILYIALVVVVMPEVLSAQNTMINLAGILLMFGAGHALAYVVYAVKHFMNKRKFEREVLPVMNDLVKTIKEVGEDIKKSEAKKTTKKKAVKKTKKG